MTRAQNQVPIRRSTEMVDTVGSPVQVAITPAPASSFPDRPSIDPEKPYAVGLDMSEPERPNDGLLRELLDCRREDLIAMLMGEDGLVVVLPDAERVRSFVKERRRRGRLKRAEAMQDAVSFLESRVGSVHDCRTIEELDAFCERRDAFLRLADCAHDEVDAFLDDERTRRGGT